LGSTDLSVSSICLGGASFGWKINNDESIAVLNDFEQCNGNFIDTADMYGISGSGESEIILGNWMASRRLREATVIMTKVGAKADRQGLSKQNIYRSCEESLTRLRTDYVDIYLLHVDDPSQRLEESAEALERLNQAGKIRYFGVSNFSASRLQEFAESLSMPESFCAVSERYSLVERDFEDELKAATIQMGVSCVPHTSLAKGFLTGKYTADTPESEWTAAHGNLGVSEYRSKSHLELIERVRHVAIKHKSSIPAVALAWLRRQPNITSPIVVRVVRAI